MCRRVNLFIVYLLAFICTASISYAEDNPIRFMFEQASAAMNNGEYQHAADIYQKITGLVPQFAAGYHFLALAKKETGAKAQEIISLLEKAAEVDPKYFPAYESLAKIYYTIGEHDKAVDFGLKALELDDKNVSVRLALGWTYLLGKDDPAAAVRHFDIALKSEPNSYGYFGNGLANFKAGNRAIVLESITQLRAMGDEEKASHLEEMLRTGQYRPPVAASQTALMRERSLIDYPPDFEAQPTRYDRLAPSTQVRLREIPLEDNPSASPSQPKENSNRAVKNNGRGLRSPTNW